MNNEAMNLSNRHSLTTMLIITSEQNTQQDAIADLFIFFIRYSFLFNEPASEEEILKRDIPYHGELSSQNPNGARYLDPKYSRWISTDPALGEYIPAAGKGNSENPGNLPGMGGIYNHINGDLYHYAGNNPVRYIDPDGRSPLSWFIPDSNKVSKEEARLLIFFYVCLNPFGFDVCSEMYLRSMSGDSTDYVKGADSHIAIVMSRDTKCYANTTIKDRLKAGKTSGSGGGTNWSNWDLKLSIGHCDFSWKLESYDKKTSIATVSVHVTDTFNFNEEAKTGTRTEDAEKLTALGRKAELTPYKVDVTYTLTVKVKMPETIHE